MDDRKAIRRLKRGDMGGLKTLMERYQVKAARATFLITHDKAVAQDVVQRLSCCLCIPRARHMAKTTAFGGGGLLLNRSIYSNMPEPFVRFSNLQRFNLCRCIFKRARTRKETGCLKPT